MTQTTGRLTAALAGRYKIEKLLGEGGMATVYLAQDIKHDRKVAVKVLRPELAAVLGAERFIQEIKTTANLQHPNILPLFDSGEADGFLYYVMPFIDGETIRDKLDRETQFGLDEAVRIATEVAGALDYAHRHDVIHRDIKPENILLHDGRPVVADFGIALAVSAAAGGRMTETGLSLGTPHYMSPEQATAEKDLTNRSDIYSLGSVLFEMLTGEPPHTGGSAQAIIMKIVTDEARPITELRKSVPPHVAAATAKSLEKMAADRFESAAKFSEALTDPTFTVPAIIGSSLGLQEQGPWKRVAVGASAVAGLFLATTLWGVLRPRPEVPTPVIRYTLTFAEEAALSARFGNSLALSPDGASLVYPGAGDQLWVRPRDQLSSRPLPGTEQAWQPFFSPDGQRVAYVSQDRSLNVVSLTGEPPVTILQAGLARQSGSWGVDGALYFTDISSLGLMRISATGAGVPEPVTTLDTTGGVQNHGFPDVLPNGKGVIFTISHNVSLTTDQDEIAVVDLATGQYRALVGGVLGKYAMSGHLVFVQADGAMLAAPFDQNKLELTGPAVPLLGEIPVQTYPDIAVSRTGRLIYASGAAGASHEVVWVDRSGNGIPVDPSWAFTYGGNGGISLSPDGSRLAVRVGEATADIWIKALDRGPLTRLTFEGPRNFRPQWTDGGRSISFLSNRNGPSYDLYEKRADGVGPARLVLDLENRITEAIWSAADDWLVLRTGGAGGAVGARDIQAMRVGTDSVPFPLLADVFDEKLPALSPDGRWLAYTSTESGGNEVFVRPFPNVEDGKWQISTNGGYGPLWSRDGKELFYQNGDAEMVVVAILNTAPFTLEEHTVLFQLSGLVTAALGNTPSYDVSPDGQRFVMVRETASSASLVVVENFFQELNAKIGPTN